MPPPKATRGKAPRSRRLACGSKAVRLTVVGLIVLLLALVTILNGSLLSMDNLSTTAGVEISMGRQLENFHQHPRIPNEPAGRFSSSSFRGQATNNALESKSTTRKLPSKKVYITSPWPPKEIVEHNLAIDPTLEFQFFNNSEMELSVKEIDQELSRDANTPGAWEAWNLLRPWAFRADLWRYMVLWQNGGVYMDAKMRLMAPIDSWATLSESETLATCHDEFKVVKDKGYTGGDIPFYWNGLLSARKRSPVLLEAIRLTIRNVQHRSQDLLDDEGTVVQSGGLGALAIAGPIVLGYAAQRVATSDNVREGPGRFESNVRLSCVFDSGVEIIYERPPEATTGFEASNVFYKKERQLVVVDKDMHTKLKHIGGGSKRKTWGDYWTLWRSGMTYCDSFYKPKVELSCGRYQSGGFSQQRLS